MDNFMKNPLMQPAYITKVVDEIAPEQSQYALINDVPLKNTDNSIVVVDERHEIGGMTQAVAAGAESPLIEGTGRTQFQFAPAHFREKRVLSENDIQTIRKLGTPSEIETAEQKVAEIVSGLRMRLETRMEWAKWQMTMGHLYLSQPDQTIDVDYGIPAEFTPVLSGVDTWDLATSDPVKNIADWKYSFRDDGSDPALLMFNANVERLLLQNAKMRALHDAMIGSGATSGMMMSREVLQRIFNTYAGMEYRVYDKGYYFKMKLKTPIVGGVTTSFTVSDNPGIAVGDTCTLVHSSGQRVAREQVDIDVSVVGNTFTTSTAPTASYPEGSELRIKRRFIPDDKFIIRGELPPGTSGGTNYGEYISTRSPYGPGGLMNPTPGVFNRIDDKSEDDPPRIEIIMGVSGLPVLYHPTANLIATVI